MKVATNARARAFADILLLTYALPPSLESIGVPPLLTAGVSQAPCLASEATNYRVKTRASYVENLSQDVSK